MIRSRRSRGIGAALLLLVVGVLTQSGGSRSPTARPGRFRYRSRVAQPPPRSRSRAATAEPPPPSPRRSRVRACATATTYPAAGGSPPPRPRRRADPTRASTAPPPTRSTSRCRIGSSTRSITGSYYTDNYGTVVAQRPPDRGPADRRRPRELSGARRPRSPRLDPSFFQSGNNTLTFVVTDVGSVTGLDYSATVNYDTLPGPVGNLLATPGNGSTVLSWAPPTDTGSLPLSATAPYVITVAGSGSGTGTTQVPPSAVQPCLGNEANVCYNVTGLTNGTDLHVHGAGPDRRRRRAARRPPRQAVGRLGRAIVAAQRHPGPHHLQVRHPGPAGVRHLHGAEGRRRSVRADRQRAGAGNFCGGAACNGNGAETICPPSATPIPSTRSSTPSPWDRSRSRRAGSHPGLLPDRHRDTRSS